jgi:predicted PurR-regulated permease PerM
MRSRVVAVVAALVLMALVVFPASAAVGPIIYGETASASASN